MRAVSLILFLVGCASPFLTDDEVRRMTNACEAQHQRSLLWRNYEMRVVGITCDRYK